MTKSSAPRYYSKFELASDKYLFSVQMRKNGIYSTFIVKERLIAIYGGATCGTNITERRIFATFGAFLRTLNMYLDKSENMF